MALRTFRSNPSLGGFGSGEADGDVFCQVLKELVDNAFDACSTQWECQAEATRRSDDEEDQGTTTTAKRKGGASRSTSARHRHPPGAKASERGCATDRRNRPNGSSVDPGKRVRVVIEPLLDAATQVPMGYGGNGVTSSALGASQGRPQEARTEALLRVTVTDNGVGMKDIQACVDPFSTSKGGRASSNSNADSTASDRSSLSAAAETATAGRYGIGLTLCLLHTQRLVPNSCAVIRSATADQCEWTQVTCVVETDRVKCVQCQRIPKSQSIESGTTISILVPGGDIAVNAYHRLAEYFARFNLSRQRTCALEIFASTLSSVPLVVRPFSRARQANRARGGRTTKSFRGATDKRRAGSEDLREATRRGMELYLERPVKLENVAHVMVPIRFHSSKGLVDGSNVTSSRSNDEDRPVLEVAFVVDTRATGDDADDAGEHDRQRSLRPVSDTSDSGTLALIRMVNGAPLLDSSEAVACGFVQGLLNKKRVWSSFGLAVSHRSDDTGASSNGSSSKAPAFSICDSDQVAPFFQRGAHALFQGEDHDEADSEGEDEFDASKHTSTSHHERRKRKSRTPRDSSKPASPQLLPAKVRLASCFCVLHIHAKPSTLPLPTLSKGRLPLDNVAIDQAMEVGLRDCLRQLQKSNPTLLLTSSQLRVVERDHRYVPQISEALARMVMNCPDPSRFEEVASTIASWDDQCKLRRPSMTELSRVDDDKSPEMKEILSQAATKDLIESRLGLALSSAGTKKRAKTRAGPSRKKGMRSVDKSQDENGDPNRTLDRCTRWADAFGDLQESDDDATERHDEPYSSMQHAHADQDDDDDDGWL